MRWIVEADVSTSDTPLLICLLARRWKSALTRSNSKICSTLARRWAFLRRSFYSTAVANRDGSSGDAGTKRKLRAEYGIDYQLLQAAKQQHKPVIELEGAENQIAMLLQLPDKGLALLTIR